MKASTMVRLNKDVQKALRIKAFEQDTTQLELLNQIVSDWLMDKQSKNKAINN